MAKGIGENDRINNMIALRIVAQLKKHVVICGYCF